MIAGIGKGVRFALQKMQEIARPIWELDDEWLQRIAFTAGRENETSRNWSSKRLRWSVGKS